MSDRLDNARKAVDSHLRDRYGMAPVLRGALDVSAIALGAYLIIDMGLFASAIGVLLVMGGLFGFLYNGGESE